IADVIMLSHNVEPRSKLGRDFVYRLGEGSRSAWPAGVFMTRDEHDELIRRLKSSTTDEVLLRTIDIVATTPENSWIPAFNGVEDQVAGWENESRCRWAEAARQLNQVAGLDFWIPTFNRVQDEVAACANCCEPDRQHESRCKWAEADRRLNQVARLAL